MNYKDKVALVTGASSGIGESFCRELHAKGASIVLVARREERLASVAAELNEKRSGSATYIKIDLSRKEEQDKLIDYIGKNNIDLLINNAGYGSFGCYEKLDIDSETDMMEVNALAPLRLTHAVVPQMKERKSGWIVNIASIAAFQPLPYMATYAATKSVNFSHSMALRAELKRHKIDVLAVCPGPVATEFGGVARVPGKMTGGPRGSAVDVVRDSLRALEKKKAYVVPGIKGWILSIPCRILPTVFTVWITERALRAVLPWAESEKRE